MSHRMIVRRGAIALALALVLAPAAQAELPRQDPAHCKGQPELKPLQPLVLHTARGPQRFMVEFAGTEVTREYGLMCRRKVAPDRGMLFDFRRPTDGVAFWMRNTVIPLDIIYIRPDGVVLSIARNVPPLDETPVPAGGVIRAVLELAAGRAAQIGLSPGDRVEHRIFRRG
ncbi:MAG: DUF192 domain-containing protein [Phenylobacterium sp.]